MSEPITRDEDESNSWKTNSSLNRWRGIPISENAAKELAALYACANYLRKVHRDPTYAAKADIRRLLTALEPYRTDK